MFKIKITKQGIQTHGARFPTQAEADAWIAGEVANNSWGKPERWLTEQEAQRLGLELSLQTRDLGTGIIEYFYAAEYTITVEDITARVALEAQQAAARKLLADTDWLVIREIDSGEPMPADIKLARQQAREIL